MDGKTSIWLTVMPGAHHHFDLSSIEFRNALALRYHRPSINMPAFCDGCGSQSSMEHALDCRIRDLVIQRHNEIRDALGDLASIAYKVVIREPVVSEATCFWFSLYFWVLFLYVLHIASCNVVKPLVPFLILISCKWCMYHTIVLSSFQLVSPAYCYTAHVHGYMRSVLFDVFCSFTSYQDNATPLYVASEKGHHDVVQTLLGAGADVNMARSVVSHVMFYYYIHKMSTH